MSWKLWTPSRPVSDMVVTHSGPSPGTNAVRACHQSNSVERPGIVVSVSSFRETRGKSSAKLTGELANKMANAARSKRGDVNTPYQHLFSASLQINPCTFYITPDGTANLVIELFG